MQDRDPLYILILQYGDQAPRPPYFGMFEDCRQHAKRNEETGFKAIRFEAATQGDILAQITVLLRKKEALEGKAAHTDAYRSASRYKAEAREIGARIQTLKTFLNSEPGNPKPPNQAGSDDAAPANSPTPPLTAFAGAALNLAATVLGNASAPDNAMLAACDVVDHADATKVINSDRAWMLDRARQVRAGIEGGAA